MDVVPHGLHQVHLHLTPWVSGNRIGIQLHAKRAIGPSRDVVRCLWPTPISWSERDLKPCFTVDGQQDPMVVRHIDVSHRAPDAAELVRIQGSELDLNNDPLGPYGEAMVDAGETTAVEKVAGRQRWDGGPMLLPGADPNERPYRVRHLVIFRAPIVGCSRPVA